MTRLVPVTVLVMLLAASRIAGADADATALDDGSTLTFNELKIHEGGSASAEFPKTTPDSLWRYFNTAHCQCAAPNVATKDPYVEKTFQYLVQATEPTGSPSTRSIDIWVGANCTVETTRPMNCRKLNSAGSVATLRSSNGLRPEVSLFDLMAPLPTAKVEDCVSTSPGAGMDALWLMVDNDGNNSLDYAATVSIPTDKGAPPLPSEFRAVGTEGGVEVSWKAPDDPSDIYAYQALCARADTDAPIGGSITARYDTAKQLCGAAIDVKLQPVNIPVAAPADGVDAGPDDAAPVVLPAAMAQLDPTFLCGESSNANASGLSITGLENGVAYKIAVLAIDKYGNPTGAFLTRTVTPVPSTDFWEDLQERNSKAEGGLCLLAETYGDDSSLTSMLRSFRDDTLGGSRAGRWLSDAYYATLGKLGGLVHGSLALRVVAGLVLAPVVALALAWHWLTLPGILALLALGVLWRRRRAMPRWLVRAPAILAIAILAPRAAHAGGYQPYWENPDVTAEDNDAPPDDPSLVKWNVGIKVGPYIPQIDKHFAVQPGPYERMFGGQHILALLEVERVIWSGFGQVAVGASAGYWQKTARAYTIDSLPGDPDRPRASDTNKFRLVPTALTVAYRFTWLDDNYGIPVVPYVRGGLSYYLWSIQKANGDYASACKDGMRVDGCDETKGYGGSLGVQGAIGLAIRAERIDSSAAISMRQSGIQHAGVFGELSVAKVDGFGSEKKLSVGDRTWFAGVNFEF